MTKKTDPSVSNGIISGLMQSPLYPLNFVKVLIQIGHEPLPPFKAKNLFGRTTFYYPNTFSYAKYIHSVEGFSGLYRGLGMKIISHSVGTLVYNQVSKMLEENEEMEPVVKEKQTENNALNIFVKQTSKEITARCWGVVVSHPFHVMALRCMAQFVGGETNYSSWNIFQNTVEIYRGEGIAGFFSGLVPRLLFEASTIALTNAIAYMIKTYIFEDKDIDAVLDLFASLLANSVTYPLSVVSTISCISGSALVAGRPPRMQTYVSWIEVFRHLYETNDLKRGASSFFRVYTSPAIGHTNTGFTVNTVQKKLK